jgi:hypothetical protein
VKERVQGGYKLESIRDEAGGHADRAVALALCLPSALAFLRDYAIRNWQGAFDEVLVS